MLQGLCSPRVHLWAPFDSVPCCEAFGTLWAAGLCSHPAHLWATSDTVAGSEALGTP